jgi:hypothetical protein
MMIELGPEPETMTALDMVRVSIAFPILISARVPTFAHTTAAVIAAGARNRITVNVNAW